MYNVSGVFNHIAGGIYVADCGLKRPRLSTAVGFQASVAE